jgi:hypothetical protein
MLPCFAGVPGCAPLQRCVSHPPAHASGVRQRSSIGRLGHYLFPGLAEAKLRAATYQDRRPRFHLGGEGAPRSVQDERRRAWMLKVNFTFSVIQLYSDDYLITSTSPHLPQDCQRIPGWRNSSLISLQSQRNLVSDCWARLQRRSLNHNEQRRITRAFLRYEILCKIFGPQHRKRTPEDYGLRYREWSAASPYSERLLQLDPFDAHATLLVNDLRMAMRFRRSTMCQRRLVMDYILAYRSNIADKHRYWDWNILQTYRSELTQGNNRQVLSCVCEYVTTGYNVLISKQVGVPIPSRQRTSPFELAQGRTGTDTCRTLRGAPTGWKRQASMRRT